MNENRYFLGLDGGGTKTHCVVYDAAADRMEFAVGGATNHEALPGGMEALPEAVGAIVLPLCARFGIAPADLAASAFGMGGVDTPMQHDLIGQMLSGLGFGRFTLANDAYLGVKAECAAEGISAVNGSGYSVVGINAAGRMLQIGGHNEMTGDRGGGAYLVPAVIRTAYAELFKDGPRTALTGMLQEWLECGDPDGFCQATALRLMADAVGSYGAVSRILYRAAAGGDAEARRILTRCGQDYALSIRCVAKKLELASPVTVVLVGSQFARCEDPCAIDALRCSLAPAAGGPVFDLRVISTEPVAGALLWALESAGVRPDRGRINQRILQLRRDRDAAGAD